MHTTASLTAWSFLDPSWTIPLVVGTVTCLAFLLGRTLLHRPRRDPELDLEEASLRCLGGVNKDRRAMTRRQGNIIEVLLSDDSGAPLRSGWVLDRSRGGLRLLVEDPVPEGTLLNVRPRTASESVPWTAIQVRSCQPERGQWELGCQFQQQPNSNILLLFG